jgi:hypothetical protein
MPKATQRLWTLTHGINMLLVLVHLGKFMHSSSVWHASLPPTDICSRLPNHVSQHVLYLDQVRGHLSRQTASCYLPCFTQGKQLFSRFLPGSHTVSTTSTAQTKRRIVYGNSFSTCSASHIFQRTNPANCLFGLRAMGANTVSNQLFFSMMRKYLTPFIISGPKFTEVSHRFIWFFRIS